MGYLASITTGLTPMPPRILIYGTEGVGKSTFAASAPKPIFIQTEDGLNQINCAKFPLVHVYQEVIDYLGSIRDDAHDYLTLTIDSLDWLERLVWDHVCERSNVKNIEKVGGGFAKGYTFALDEWREIIDILNTIRSKRNMAIILVAHAKIEKFEDPESPTYDRYSPRLHKHATALFSEWADAVLFATRKSITVKEGKGFEERNIAQPIGKDGGERIIRSVGSPACVAKNRYGMPDQLPLAWGSVAEHILKGN